MSDREGKEVRDAEACGTIAGALATGEAPQAAAWLTDEPARFSAFADACREAFRASRLTLPSALSDGALPLALRVEMLAAFTHGFLSGLGQAGERLGALGAGDAEMLRNLEAISRRAALDADADEAARAEDERAYGELVAYLRFAADRFYHALA